jgi:CheY-like chemotaxis protein
MQNDAEQIESKAQRRPLIILVEDDPNDVELFTIALEKSGVPHRLMVAKDGQEGVDMMSDPVTDDPDLILTDLKMPRLNGFDLLERVRSNPKTKNVPVVLFSSSRATSDVEGAYERDANAYVCKPVRFAEFIETVRNIAEFWVLRNETPNDPPTTEQAAE